MVSGQTFTGCAHVAPERKITGLGAGQMGGHIWDLLLTALSDFTHLSFLIYKLKKNDPGLREGPRTVSRTHS